MDYVISALLFAWFTTTMVIADMVTVHNQTDFDINFGTYYYLSPVWAKRVGDIKDIPGGQAIALDRPRRELLLDRQLIFSLNSGDLKSRLSDDEYKILRTVNIGDTQGSNFYIDLNKGHLAGYNFLEWKVVQPIRKRVQEVSTIFDNQTWGQLRKKFEKHPYGTMEATVRTSTSLPDQEKAYLRTRMPHVKTAVESMLGTKLHDNEVPRIAFCCSGGGYRAMIATLGSFIGADSFGLLKSSIYMAGLSGSTWFIAPWTHSGATLQDFKKQLIPIVQRDIFKVSLNYNQLLEVLLQKVAFGQPISLVDVYGAVLAYKLLAKGSGNPYDINLSSHIQRIAMGTWLYPIYTAVTELPYVWVEFTPYEIGSNDLGGYIPSWSFGRRFLQGKSQDRAPSQSLGYLMGIWGSAFAANVKEIVHNFEQAIQYEQLRGVLKVGLDVTRLGKQRFSSAQVLNFTYGMLKLLRGQEEVLTLVDAGLSFNLPLPPLMRKERAVDIIIVLDASSPINKGEELQKAQTYLKAKGIKIPPINYEAINSSIYSVFYDPEDTSIPTIIYMPLVKNSNYSNFDPLSCSKDYCSTFNFSYTAAQFEELSGLTEFNMKESKDSIIKAIRRVVEAKRTSPSALVS
jgi:cytosolic phospholipase A2